MQGHDGHDKNLPRSRSEQVLTFTALQEVYLKLTTQIDPLLVEYNRLDSLFNFNRLREEINESAQKELKRYEVKEPLSAQYFAQMKVVYKIVGYLSSLQEFIRDADAYLDTVTEATESDIELEEQREWAARFINTVDAIMVKTADVYLSLPDNHFFKVELRQLCETEPHLLAFIRPYLDETEEQPFVAAMTTLTIVEPKDNDTRVFMQAKRLEHFKAIAAKIRDELEIQYNDLMDEFEVYDEDYWTDLICSKELSYEAKVRKACDYIDKLKPVRVLILTLEEQKESITKLSEAIDSPQTKQKMLKLIAVLAEMCNDLMTIIEDIKDLKDNLSGKFESHKDQLNPELAEFMKIWSKDGNTVNGTLEAIIFLARIKKTAEMSMNVKVLG